MSNFTKLFLAPVCCIGIGLSSRADAQAGIVQISSDPFTNPDAQHMTEVEPSAYAYGSTIVAVFQQGRIFGGGASDIGFATSTDSGGTWQHGSLPGLTIWAGGNFYTAVTDPSITHSDRDGLFLAVATPYSPERREVLLSRSADGLNWDDPIMVYSGSVTSRFEAPWIACDNGPTSPFFGNCYAEWDDIGLGFRIQISTSTDGGATWRPPLSTADRGTGNGGRPTVQPSGRVVVPYETTAGHIRGFVSDDGGDSWSSTISLATVREHYPTGNLREVGAPSVGIDGDGTVYVVWTDCRFREFCLSNDLLMISSSDGVNWSDVKRVPIDDTSSHADHFLPGLGVDRNTFAPNVGLAILYYYYPEADCTASTCQLIAAFITSADGGDSWSDPIDLSEPMSLDWLPDTSSGRMVGDYFSTYYTDDGIPHPVFAKATAPGEQLSESMFTTTHLSLGPSKRRVTATLSEVAPPDPSAPDRIRSLER
jgi:hypothetical protein